MSATAKWRVVCKHCDGTPEAHHDFVPKMPPGCVCEPGEWIAFGNDLITLPCDSYEPLEHSDDDLCAKCEHDRACHGAAA